MGFFFTLVYTIASYLRPWELFPELKDFRVMLVLGAICGAAVVSDTMAGATEWLRAPQTWLMTAFVAWLGVSVALTGWLGGALVAWSDFSSTALVFLFVAITVNSLKRVKIVGFTIVCCTLILAFEGVAAYHFGYRSDILVVSQTVSDTGAASSLLENPARIERIRSVGFLNDPNDFAQAMLLALPLLGIGGRQSNPLSRLLLVFIPVATLLYATYLTYSRGALIALAVIVLMMLQDRFGWLLTSAVAAAMSVLALASKVAGRGFSTSEESAAGRVDAWSTGVELFRSHPISGVGYNRFEEYNDLTAHNSYVLCFAELGAVGYFLWLSLIVVSTVQLNGVLNSVSVGDESYRPATAIRKSLFAFLASAFFLSRTYSPTLYILLGLSAGFYGFTHRGDTGRGIRFWDCTWRTVAAGLFSIVCIYCFIVATHLLGG